MVTLGVGGFYAYNVFLDENKEELLIGDASHGHFQIELDCGACHTDAFGGPEVLQDACVSCHAADLELAQDSHPLKKFRDPRNASLLKGLDARQCISCHTEHQDERTHPMGVTIPEDYCFHCHQSIAEDRPSHVGLGYETCASAGCHNYHDNRALYETFLASHSGESWIKTSAQIVNSNNASLNAQPTEEYQLLAYVEKSAEHPEVVADWSASAHAEAGVNCGGCHSDEAQGESNLDVAYEGWVEKPGIEVCASCHGLESQSFLIGKHGMRLAAGLDPLDPSEIKTARTLLNDGATGHNGCNNCHKPHEFDRTFAATEACLTCHADDHSLAFLDSPHAEIVQTLESKGVSKDVIAGSAVTCATCHMPSILVQETVVGTSIGTELANYVSTTSENGGGDVFMVNHNQNENLRPNEKMIRPVCMQCHGLGFAIDALADPELIKNNFNGQPSEHIPSIDWSVKNQSR